MKLAMSNIAWSPEDRLQAYRILSEAGITGLEIAPGLFFHATHDPFVPDAATAGAALEEISDAGLTLVSMQSLLFGVTGAELFGGEDASTAMEVGIVRAIELAGRFNIHNLVFGSPGQRRVPDGMTMEDALEKAAEVFQRLGDNASKAGTKIAIEANPAAYGTNFLNTLEEARAFVERVNHPAIVAILDLGEMHINGTFDEVPVRISRLMPHLNHVHVSEPNLAPAPEKAEALIPALQALQTQGYDKAISIEMKRPEGGLAVVESAVQRLIAAFEALDVTHA